MAFWVRDSYKSKDVRVSLGSWMAKLIANSADPTDGEEFIKNFYQTDLITFSNRALLRSLQQSYPGVSRQINFNPIGLGIGTIFKGFSGTTTQGPFFGGSGKPVHFREPNSYNNNGNVKHTFVARGWDDRSAADSDDLFGGVSYLDYGFTPPPGAIGLGGEAIVSQPIKQDERIYFEIEVTKAQLQDSNGYAPPITRIGRGKNGGAGSDHFSGGVQLTIAPENWFQYAGSNLGNGRSFNLNLITKGLLGGHGQDRTGSGTDLADMTIDLSGFTHFEEWRTNVSPDSDTDVANLTQSGDIIMIAIDQVADSIGENRLFWGVNGVWAKADSDDVNYGVIASHTTFDPADDAMNLSDALRPGIPMEATEDPYYIYLGPMWTDSSVRQGLGKSGVINYAGQATAGGTYKYCDLDLTIKTGTDVTYTPPTSGRGYTFKAH